jgi:glucose-6-phosphate isomerase
LLKIVLFCTLLFATNPIVVCRASILHVFSDVCVVPLPEILVDGKDVMPDVRQVLEQMYKFADSVRDGAWKGYSGKRITDVVNIGIGGSDLGPVMVVNSLTPYTVGAPRMHFVSNVDGTHLSEALKAVNHETVLFLVASKTFTTQETLTNASSARAWLVKAFGGDEKCVERHFAALSTNLTATGKFGIAPQNVFAFWDWVGGRYSLWSAIGLSIAIAIGPKHFDELLSGAFAVDEHYRTTTDYRKNIPVQLALTGIWYNNFWGAQTHAVLPYAQQLHRFAAYLQQLTMESNGKSVRWDGTPVTSSDRRGVLGRAGHQRPARVLPADPPGHPAHPVRLHRAGAVGTTPASPTVPAHDSVPRQLLRAARGAGMKGKTADEVRAELKAAKLPDADIEKLTPHKTFTGNRPTNSFLFKKLTPFVLGSLIALYEHKTHAQGVIWNISSFCQEGVQLGKVLAQVILPELAGDAKVASHDASTNGLINHFKKLR